MIRYLTKSTILKAFSLFFAFQMMINPLMLYAGIQNADPQPEFSQFNSARNTGTNVDLYSGDFSYNLPVIQIPDIDGSGYALSLSYNSSAIKPESDASWVGWGWNLNPGSISRIKRGLPDDYNGESIRYINKRPKVSTFTITKKAGLELYSFDLFTATNRLIWNSKRGLSQAKGIHFGILNGLYTLDIGLENGDVTNSRGFNPAALLDINTALSKASLGSKGGFSTPTEFRHAMNSVSWGLSSYLNHHISTDAYPVFYSGYSGTSISGDITFQGNISPLHLGLEGGIGFSNTWQEPTEEESVKAYGWMYTGNGEEEEQYIGKNSKNLRVLDYSYDRAAPYSKLIKYLPVPFNNHDLFQVSGEGISGTFRAYLKDIGTFSPNIQKNKSLSVSIGGDVAVGLNNSGGANISVSGSVSSEVEGWKGSNENNHFAKMGDTDEAVIMRFNGDKGGNLVYSVHNEPVPANIFTSGLKGSQEGTYTYPINYPSQASFTGKDRSGRSSYIGFNTNAGVDEKHGNTQKPLRAYSRAQSTEGLLSRESLPQDGIGEFSITNEMGQHYTYGLPVYNHSEYDLRWSVNRNDGVIDDKRIYVNYFDIEAALQTENYEVAGTIDENKYASSFLLTEIKDPNYIDRTLDGVTDDDFGGWTRFEYRKKSENFKWRYPYKGLVYENMSPSDLLDDLGIVQYGYKDLLYLKKIETKSHVACFVTNGSEVNDFGFGASLAELNGSGEERLDGTEAHHFEPNAMNGLEKGSQKAEKLEKIILYAKKPDGSLKKLQTVRFDYDYSLQKGQPNSTSIDPATSGKLTLKRVWVEHKDVVEAEISPYEFSYEYKTHESFDPDVQSEYSHITNYAKLIQEDPSAQNPDYIPNQSDRWGNYKNIEGKYVYQNPQSNHKFDPAAWMLKQIKLPSRGEILVQYEADDFAYVQDKKAHAMATLDGTSTVEEGYLILNVAPELGVSSNDLQLYADYIKKEYTDRGKPLYFNFMYALKGEAVAADEESCNMEPIDGYVYTKNVKVQAGKLLVELDNPQFPKDMCKDFFEKNRVGLIEEDCSTSTELFDLDNTKETAYALLGFATGLPTKINNDDICKSIYHQESYLRLPVWKRKFGGGIRVKRLLNYAEGLEYASLYGNQYSYTTKQVDRIAGVDVERVISSGVAANEPNEGAESNALMDLINFEADKEWYQALGDKWKGNKYKNQIDGNLAKNLLPGASVGYSRVMRSNINEKLSAPGFVVNEFYTTKEAPVSVKVGANQDFPTIGYNTTEIKRKNDFLVLPLGVFNKFVSQEWASQGYSFTIYNIEGNPKSVSTYGGNPKDSTNWKMPTAKKTYIYKPVSNTDEAKANIYQDINDFSELNYLGKEQDFIAASEAIKERDTGVTLQFDAGAGIFVYPIPFASLIPTVNVSKSGLYTHTTNKITHFTPVLEHIISEVDGVTSYTYNEAFDPETGNASVTRATDGFDGLPLANNIDPHNGTYTSYNFPATLAYDNFKQVAGNQGKKFVSGEAVGNEVLSINIITDGNKKYLSLSPENPNGDGTEICNLYKSFASGDMVLLTKQGDPYQEVFYLGEQKAPGLEIIPVGAFGSVYPQADIAGLTVEVLRSGKNNVLNASIGSLTTYGEGQLPEYIPVDPDLIALRVEFAQLIHDSNQNLSEEEGAMVAVPVPGGLQMLNEAGECVDIGESVFLIRSEGPALNLRCAEIVKKISDGYTLKGMGIHLPKGVTITYDETTNKLGQRNGECGEFFPIECIEFCPALYPKYILDGVISASAITLNDKWQAFDHPKFGGNYEPKSASVFESGEKGKWRIKESYSYNTDRTIGHGTQRVYNSGVFKEFSLFNWEHPAANEANWIKNSKTLTYTPDGIALETEDAFKIPTVQRLGYNMELSVANAANAYFEQVAFHSFEDFETGSQTYSGGDTMEDGLVVADVAHSGNHSVKLEGNFSSRTFRSPVISLDAAGLLVQMWVKNTGNTPGQIQISLPVPYETDVVDAQNYVYEDFYFSPIAQTGEWVLYEVDAQGITATSKPPGIKFTNWSGSIYIDDIRWLPTDARMSCTVYDPNDYKVLATFGQQHFGTYFQYDTEGKLMRQVLETEEGMRTVSEQHYHVPKVLRNK